MIYIVTTHAREFIPLKYEMKATPLTTSLVSFPSNHLDSKSLVFFLLFFFFFLNHPLEFQMNVCGFS